MKNPYFNVNLHFKFVDTSLCYAKFSMTRENKSVRQDKSV